MKKQNPTKIIVSFIALIVIVISLSIISNKIWGGKPETFFTKQQLTFKENMTVIQFGQVNTIPNQVLKEVFQLQDKQDLKKTVVEFGLSETQITKKVNQLLALHSEDESKNWLKIRGKFASWFVFLIVVFLLMRKAKITPTVRKMLYGLTIVIFGVVLGSDPSPMGTVKDAIVLFASKNVIFPPRLIALTIFLLLVLIANKFICSWGCQFGVLQDLIFRLNRNKKDSKGILKQYKIPFVVSNFIRLIFFLIFTAIAFAWAFDLVGAIDPFKIYKPLTISLIGGIFLVIMLIASLFFYRPWCHLFCPFGLVGWLMEKISIFKIKVDYDRCTACELCSKACPSTVMEAILKRGKKVIPDCFACSTCIDICPVDAIQLGAGKRSEPPLNKFRAKDTE